MIRRLMTFHVIGASGWLFDPEQSVLPWMRLSTIYASINGGRFVGPFGFSIT